MPRTPLLSRLVDLAAASRRADGLGTDVIEVLGRRDEALASDEGLTRRTLVKQAVVAGVGLTALGRMALQPEQAFAGPKKAQPRVASSARASPA